MSLLVGCITFVLAELFWYLQMAPAVSWSPWISVPAGLLCGVFAAGLAHKATWYVLSFPENALNNPAPLYTWKDEKLAIQDVVNLLTNYRFYDQDLHVDHNETQRVRASRWFSSRHWTGGGALGTLSDIYGTITMSFADIEIDFAVSVRVERYDEFNSKVYIEFTNEANPRIINLWGAPVRNELMQLLVDLLQVRREPYREKPAEAQGIPGHPTQLGYAQPNAQAEMQEQSQLHYARPNNAAAMQTSAEMHYASTNSLAEMHDPAPVLTEAEVMQIWQAANGGDPDSLLQLGRLYAQGSGVIQSWPDAATCIGMAASKGNVNAMFEFGTMLCRGLGVGADPAHGAQWLQAAAAQGHPAALAALQSMTL